MNIKAINSILENVNELINSNFISGDEEIEIEIYELSEEKIDNKQFLKNLGKYSKIKKSDTKFKCPICLEEVKTGEYQRILPLCNHKFHKKCIDKWMTNNDETKECPVCRCNYDNFIKDSQ